MAGQEICQKVLDRHSSHLMQMPGVEGIGISLTPHGHPTEPCAIVVYTTTEARPELIPSWLDVELEGHDVASVPVEFRSIGHVALE